MVTQTVTTPQGIVKVLRSEFPSDLSTGVTVALAEPKPKTAQMDINNKAHGNKRVSDL